MAETGEFNHTKNGDFQKPCWLFTIYWLIYRNFLKVIRDPSVQSLRIVQKLVSNINSTLIAGHLLLL